MRDKSSGSEINWEVRKIEEEVCNIDTLSGSLIMKSHKIVRSVWSLRKPERRKPEGMERLGGWLCFLWGQE